MTVKRPAVAASGMVTSNHPLASLAGAEMLVAGGNAVDAAIATMFALSVAEPMMTTIFGAGFVTIRLPSGTCTTIDGYATVPARATADMYDPVPGSLDHEVHDGLNVIGHRSVAVGGTLLAWCTAVERYGRLPLGRVVAPAIRFARDGFRVSSYLRSVISLSAHAIRRFPETAKVFLPGDVVPAIGDTIVRTDYAATLARVAEEGPGHLYGGPLGEAIGLDMAANGGLVTSGDIQAYRIYEREPVRGTYRGHEITSMAPPSSGGTHIVQMLNILEAFDVRAIGFGTPDGVHLLAEAMKIAFADRFRYMADPATTDVPVGWLTSKRYAAERRAQIDMARAQQFVAAVPPDGESENTTHCCVMDDEGMVVSSTGTLHHPFGSKVTVPGTGMLLNDCMQLMDPTPGRTNSIAPGKRILSSMSPTIVERGGGPYLTLGTPGGLKIFGSVLQAIVNVVDHGMTIQEAFEAPRMWDRGPVLEIERGFPQLEALTAELERRGHVVATPVRIAGGMNGIMRDEDGTMTGAACWRADGAAVGVSAGDAVVGPSDAAPYAVT